MFYRPYGSRREEQSRRSTRGHRRRRNEKGSSHHLCQFHGSGLDLLYSVGQLKEHFSFCCLDLPENLRSLKNDKNRSLNSSRFILQMAFFSTIDLILSWAIERTFFFVPIAENLISLKKQKRRKINK